MIVSSLAPWFAAAVLGVLAPSLARRMHPRVGPAPLAVGGLVVAAVTAAVSAVVVAVWVGQQPMVGRLGHWSAPLVGADDPFPLAARCGAAVLLAAAAAGVVRAVLREGRRTVTAWRLARRQPPGLVVLDEAAPLAYALPGWPGRVVVSRGLLRRLDGAGRRSLLAHETAHLRYRHDLTALAAGLAAGLNPLLAALPAAVRTAGERQADEYAARVVGDRRAVAAAITTAVAPDLALTAFAAGGADVPRRVAALLRPATRDGLSAALAPALLVALAAASWLWLAHDLDHIFDAAALALAR